MFILEAVMKWITLDPGKDLSERDLNLFTNWFFFEQDS